MTAQKHALYALLNQAKLSAVEIASLTVADVHLSDAEPHLMVWDEETGRRERVIVLPVVKNALVAWLVARPDQPSALLFPAENGGELSAAEIMARLEGYIPPAGNAPVISADTRTEERLPSSPHTPQPPPFRAAPPPTVPEHVQPYSAEKTPVMPTVSGTESVAVTPRWNMLVIGGLIGLAIIGGAIVGGMALFNRGDDAQPVAATTPVPTDTAMPANKPVPTATPQPTNTPQLPTATPPPTNTQASSPTPAPTDTPTAIPSPTPAPTNTPQPPTATPVPPTNTPVPVVNPAPPSPTPTTGLKYAAPTLISPEAGYPFKGGVNIHLNWESVGPLAGNEQYAVRLVYKHNTQITYRGIGTKDTTWLIPPEFFRDADGPEFDYEWYVFVEEIQPDGVGIPISPESEHRHFTWD